MHFFPSAAAQFADLRRKAGIEWHLTGDFAALLISISADVSRFTRPLGYLGTFRNARSSDPADGLCHHVGGARQAPEWFRAAPDRLNARSERSGANALGPLCLENIWGDRNESARTMPVRLLRGTPPREANTACSHVLVAWASSGREQDLTPFEYAASGLNTRVRLARGIRELSLRS